MPKIIIDVVELIFCYHAFSGEKAESRRGERLHTAVLEQLVSVSVTALVRRRRRRQTAFPVTAVVGYLLTPPAHPLHTVLMALLCFSQTQTEPRNLLPVKLVGPF